MKNGIKPFAEQGHYTETHNMIFDYIMPRVSGSAFKVLCLILRATKGWGKRSDKISYRQICEGTGIGSKATVSKAIKQLLEMGCILCKSGREGCTTSAYALNLKYTIPMSEIYSSDEDSDGSKNEPDFGKNTGSKNEPPVNDNSLTGSENEPVSGSENEPPIESETGSKNEHTKENKTSTNQDSTFNQSESTLTRTELRRKVLEVTGKLLDSKRGTLSALDERAVAKLLAKLQSDGRLVQDVEIYRAALPGFFGRAPEEVTPPSPSQMHSNFDRVLLFAAQSQISKNGEGVSLDELRRRTAELKQS